MITFWCTLCNNKQKNTGLSALPCSCKPRKPSEQDQNTWELRALLITRMAPSIFGSGLILVLLPVPFAVSRQLRLDTPYEFPSRSKTKPGNINSFHYYFFANNKRKESYQLLNLSSQPLPQLTLWLLGSSPAQWRAQNTLANSCIGAWLIRAGPENALLCQEEHKHSNAKHGLAQGLRLPRAPKLTSLSWYQPFPPQLLVFAARRSATLLRSCLLLLLSPPLPWRPLPRSVGSSSCRWPGRHSSCGNGGRCCSQADTPWKCPKRTTEETFTPWSLHALPLLHASSAELLNTSSPLLSLALPVQ